MTFAFQVEVHDRLSETQQLELAIRAFEKYLAGLRHKHTHALGSWDHHGSCEEWIERELAK